MIDFGGTHIYKKENDVINKTPAAKLKQQSKSIRSEYANRNILSRKASKRNDVALTNGYLANDSFRFQNKRIQRMLMISALMLER